MADALTWDSVLASSLSVGIGLLPIFIAYLLNERSKRRDFARKERHDRKFAAYTAVLAAIRRRWDASMAAEMFTSDAKLKEVMKDFKPEQFEAASAFLKTLATLYLATRYPGRMPSEFERAALDDGDSKKGLDRFTNQGALNAMRIAGRAEENLQTALDTLQLSGAPLVIQMRLKSLADCHARMVEHEKDKLEWYEKELADVQALMKADLDATIQGIPAE